MATMTPSPTQANIDTALRNFITAIIPGIEVVRGQDNKVGEPRGNDHIVFWPMRRPRLTTNVDTFATAADPASALSVMGEIEVVMRIDVHGPNASDNAQLIRALFRDEYGVNAINATNPVITPLYCDDPRQVPFTNAEQMVEYRWVIEAHLQANESLILAQDSAIVLALKLVEADVTPPSPPPLGLAARTSLMSRGSGTLTTRLLTALAARASLVSRGMGNLTTTSGLLGLSARTSLMSKGTANPIATGATMALSARAIIRNYARAKETVAAALAGTAKSTVRDIRSGEAGKAALTARTATMLKDVRSGEQGNTTIVARTSAMLKARFATAPPSVALAGRIRPTVTTRGGVPIVLVNSTGPGNFNSVSSVTLGLPGNRANGNLLIAYVQASLSATPQIVSGAGWTIGDRFFETPGGSAIWLWRLVDGTETNLVINWGGGSAPSGKGRMFQFTGNDPVAPIGNFTHNNATSGTTLSCPGVVTTKDLSLMLAIGGVLGSFQTFGVPNFYTQLVAPDNNNTSDGVWTEPGPALGATNDAVSLTITSAPWVAMVIELKHK